MTVTSTDPAPYVPPTTLIALLRRYRSRGLQAPFTSEVLERSGVAESLASRTLAALQSLDLVDDGGNPTEALEALATAPGDEYKDRLAAILRSAYAEVFNFVDPAADDVSGIRDAFRAYSPRGQQSRMVTLFLGLCLEAGIIDQMPTRPGPKPGVTRKPAAARTGSKAKPKPRQRKRDTTGSDLPEPIAGLLYSLPDSGWSQAQRDKFLATFTAVLDYCVPVVEEAESEEESE